MKPVISRKAHGLADYVYIPLTAAAPELFDFRNEPAATRICRVMGGGVLAQALLTKAEWGLAKVVPYKAHVAMDFCTGLFSLAAPWLFGFSKNRNARNTFLALGATGVAAALLSSPPAEIEDDETAPNRSNLRLKPLSEQVMVITGASSGIGLATAEAAAKKGTKVVLAARSLDALNEVVSRIRATGGEAIAVQCDVSKREDMEALANAAVSHFGRIDTWVNDAGLGMFGRLDEVSEADGRRLFDINYWGVVNGSLVALDHLRENGGALINVGSEVSEAVAPLLGTYSATKHAVKGFTDALRLEVEEVDQAPVAITLIQPTAVDTPFPQHSRNYMSQEGKVPTPTIEPSQVAKAILSAATKPTRAVRVGAMSKLNTTMAKFAPGLGDKLAAKQVNRLQYQEPPRHPAGALNEPSSATGVVGQTHGTGGVEK